MHFPFNNNFYASLFDLVHVDIWGAYFVLTHGGFRYFLFIVDDATRSTWVYLLKAKSDVRSILNSFYRIIQTQFKTNIKFVRLDNGQEFAMVDFYNAHGIIHQKSCVYTLQQNFMVERKHQHLLSIARALKLQSNVHVIGEIAFLL